MTTRGDHDVRGLEVAVHDAALVRVPDRVRERQREVHDFGQRELSLRDDLRERAPFDQLERDVVAALRLADFVDRRDVRMRELRDRARLAKESRASARKSSG